MGRLTNASDDHASLCTGTLISDRIVLTAGHCALQPEGYQFALEGEPAAEVAMSSVHADRQPQLALTGIPDDLARLVLNEGLAVSPMPIGAAPEPGEALHLATYSNAKPEALTQQTCPVTEIEDRLVILDCAVTSGMSGAPLLRLTDRGPVLVAIIIARGDGVAYAAVPDDWARRTD